MVIYGKISPRRGILDFDLIILRDIPKEVAKIKNHCLENKRDRGQSNLRSPFMLRVRTTIKDTRGVNNVCISPSVGCRTI